MKQAMDNTVKCKEMCSLCLNNYASQRVIAVVHESFLFKFRGPKVAPSLQKEIRCAFGYLVTRVLALALPSTQQCSRGAHPTVRVETSRAGKARTSSVGDSSTLLLGRETPKNENLNGV